MNREVTDEINGAISKLDDESKVLYDEIDEAIPPSVKLNELSTTNTSTLIDEILKNTAGAPDSPIIKDVKSFLNKSKPTVISEAKYDPVMGKNMPGVSEPGDASLGGMDKLRKLIGSKLDRLEYGDGVTRGEAKMLYGALSKDIASFYENAVGGEYADKFLAATALKSKSFDYKDKLENLVGKDFVNGSMVSNVNQAINRSLKGDNAELLRISDNLSEEQRKKVFSTSFANSVIDQKGDLDFNSLNKVMDGLRSNPEAFKTLTQGMGEGSKKFLTQLSSVSKSLDTIKKSSEKAGLYKDELLKQSNIKPSLSKRIVTNVLSSVGFVAATKTIGSLGSGSAASATIKSVFENSDSVTVQAAGDMLVSKEFSNYLKAAGEGKPLEEVKDKLIGSTKFKKFAEKIGLTGDRAKLDKYLNSLMTTGIAMSPQEDL